MTLTWKDDETFVVGETTFRVLPRDAFAKDRRAAHARSRMMGS